MHGTAARVCRLAAAAARHTAQLQRRRGAPAPAPQRYTTVPVTAVATPWHKHSSARPITPSMPWTPSVSPAAPAPSPLPPPARPQGAHTLQPGLLGALWQRYLHSLERRPLLTKAATSFVCICVGDGIAQAIGGAPFSAARLLRLAAYSSTVGAATGHYWHRWLEAHIFPDNPTSDRAVGAKVVLDQLALTPVMTAVFFTALKLMEGRPDAVLPFLQEKYLQTLLAGYAVWFPWNYASFKWIPQDLRILAGNLVGIAWGTYVSVSCLNSAAPACAAAVAGAEALPAVCPAVMAAVEAGALGATVGGGCK